MSAAIIIRGLQVPDWRIIHSASRAHLSAQVTHAQVAQLVEHATENRSVGGSIPPLGTIPDL